MMGCDSKLGIHQPIMCFIIENHETHDGLVDGKLGIHEPIMCFMILDDEAHDGFLDSKLGITTHHVLHDG